MKHPTIQISQTDFEYFKNVSPFDSVDYFVNTILNEQIKRELNKARISELQTQRPKINFNSNFVILGKDDVLKANTIELKINLLNGTVQEIADGTTNYIIIAKEIKSQDLEKLKKIKDELEKFCFIDFDYFIEEYEKIAPPLPNGILTEKHCDNGSIQHIIHIPFSHQSINLKDEIVIAGSDFDDYDLSILNIKEKVSINTKYIVCGQKSSCYYKHTSSKIQAGIELLRFKKNIKFIDHTNFEITIKTIGAEQKETEFIYLTPDVAKKLNWFADKEINKLNIQKLKNIILNIIKNPTGTGKIRESQKERLYEAFEYINSWIDDLTTIQANEIINTVLYVPCCNSWYIDGLPILKNSFFKTLKKSNELTSLDIQIINRNAQDKNIDITTALDEHIRKSAVFNELFSTGDIFYNTLESYQEWGKALEFITHVLQIDSISPSTITYVNKENKVITKKTFEYTFTIRNVVNKEIQLAQKYHRVSNGDFRALFIDGNFEIIEKYRLEH